MAVGIVLWSVIYQELWGREEKIVAVKWGTSGFEEIEKDRFVWHFPLHEHWSSRT